MLNSIICCQQLVWVWACMMIGQCCKILWCCCTCDCEMFCSIMTALLLSSALQRRILQSHRICWAKKLRFCRLSCHFSADRCVKYCDPRVCVFICLSTYISWILHIKFSVCVTSGSGSVLLWQQYDTLCTSGFVDDIMFSYHGENRPKSKATHMFYPVLQVAAPEAKFAIFDCIL